MSLSFRTKSFLVSLGVAAAALAFLTVIIALQRRSEERAGIEARLVSQAQLIAELLSQNPSLTSDQALDDEADRLAQLLGTRVTLIAPDGRVVGDSDLEGQALADVENHLQRPEVQDALTRGVGVVARYSTTVRIEMLYAAVTARHPRVRYVRVALPLTTVSEELRRVGLQAVLAFALAAPFALALAWLASALLSKRVRAIAEVAQRYSQGDLTRPTYDYGPDELGAVARVLDGSVQELGHRLEELSRDRARMEAILSGMVEGVLVVDGNGRLQLANRAAQAMLRMDASSIGRPYVEVIRHPDIASQLGTALRGKEVDNRELALTRSPGRTFVARAAPVSSSGGGAVLVLHDITDLRRADQIRRDFVANVSHELRTPLTAIRGYVEALLDDRPEEDEGSSWRSSRATARAWSGSSATCCAWRGSTPSRKRSTHLLRHAAAVQHRHRRRRADGRIKAPGDHHRRRIPTRAGSARTRRSCTTWSAISSRTRSTTLRRRQRFGWRRHARMAPSPSPSPTRGPAFRPRISRACSSGSIAWTSRARARAAPASAWPSSSIWWSCMAAGGRREQARRRCSIRNYPASQRENPKTQLS